jgi:tRNA A-37 threonylcarbamoyl transferase component Bud32
MSTDLPDDDDPWASVELPDDDEIQKDNLLPPELQREFDRLLAAHTAAESSSQERLTPDLEELEAQIADTAARRKTHGDAVPPYMFDRFEALDTMRGGMGLVIKARDPQLERYVAIKLWMRSGPEAQQALLAEAKILAKLKHANVVMVHETGVWKDRVYFVMEWIEGVDGHDWMERPRSWREVRRVFVAAGTGLAAAHTAGIHHRDFKPSNILIGNDGRVVVADFGVADSLHSSPERDELGKVAGTPSYMAPERLRGKRGDARSDQFSFCAAMWRALYRRRPFAGNTIEELIESIEFGEIQEAPGNDVPRWLSAVLRKGIAYAPDERHRDMRALVAALLDEPPDEPALDDDEGDGEVVVGRHGRVLHKSGMKETAQGAAAQRERGPYAAIGFLSAMVVVLGFTTLMRSPTPEPEPPAAEAVAPYHVILGLVVDDKFAEAEGYWADHRSEVTDAESLKIARACLARSKLLVEPADRATSKLAAFTAWSIANYVQNFGKTEELKKEGGQLAEDTQAVDRPSSTD